MNACVVCGTTLPEQTGRGRPRKYCTTSCSDIAQGRAKPMPRGCHWCGTGFVSVRYRSCCSPRCTRAITRARARTEQAYCKHCDEPFQRVPSTTRPKLYCTTTCQYEYRSSEYKQREHPQLTGAVKNNPSYDLGQYYEALLADPCAYCGEPSTEIDHITPRSLGGANEWENYAGVCSPCNASKSAKLPVTYLGWRSAQRSYDGWRLLAGQTKLSRVRTSGGA